MNKRIVLTWVLGFFLLLAAGGAWAASDNWRNLSPREKDRILQNYRRWQDLPPKDKEHLREEWNRWQNLPKDRRDRLKQRFDEQRRDRNRD